MTWGLHYELKGVVYGGTSAVQTVPTRV